LAVRIRLLRMGKKKRPFYRIVVADSRTKRDGKYIEKIGYYDPIPDPAEVKIDREKAIEWLKKGAQPTDTVYSLFKKEGIALEWHLIRHNVDEKVRNIEIQKWEMARKLKEEAIRKKEEKEEEKVGELETEVAVEEKASEESKGSSKDIEEAVEGGEKEVAEEKKAEGASESSESEATSEQGSKEE